VIIAAARGATLSLHQRDGRSLARVVAFSARDVFEWAAMRASAPSSV
jgi:hypothetical protein